MVAAGLEYDVLRLTIAANYGHGTKITGERATKRRRYLKQYVEKQCTEWFEDLAEEIRLDRRLELSDVDHVNARLLVEDYLQSPSICGRGKYDPCIHFQYMFFLLLFFAS